MRRISIVGWVVRGAAGLLVMAVATYPADWVVWRLRGAPMGQVQVSHMTSAALKGNKTSYFYDGTQILDCSRSLYAEAGAGACWLLARSPVVIETY